MGAEGRPHASSVRGEASLEDRHEQAEHFDNGARLPKAG
jgi:hypothetical protein